MASRIGDAVARFRGRRLLSASLCGMRPLSADASHRLRTPLAALRVRLEDLSLWPEIDERVRRELLASLAEVDRLSSTVDDLLDPATSDDPDRVTRP